MRAPSGFQVSWYWSGVQVVWAAMAALPKTGACLLLRTTALSANQEAKAGPPPLATSWAKRASRSKRSWVSGVMVGSARDMPVEVQAGEPRLGVGQAIWACALPARKSARLSSVERGNRKKQRGIARILYGAKAAAAVARRYGAAWRMAAEGEKKF
jgi:hypothetical protein